MLYITVFVSIAGGEDTVHLDYLKKILTILKVCK